MSNDTKLVENKPDGEKKTTSKIRKKLPLGKTALATGLLVESIQLIRKTEYNNFYSTLPQFIDYNKELLYSVAKHPFKIFFAGAAVYVVKSMFDAAFDKHAEERKNIGTVETYDIDDKVSKNVVGCINSLKKISLFAFAPALIDTTYRILENGIENLNIEKIVDSSSAIVYTLSAFVGVLSIEKLSRYVINSIKNMWEMEFIQKIVTMLKDNQANRNQTTESNNVPTENQQAGNSKQSNTPTGNQKAGNLSQSGIEKQTEKTSNNQNQN
ncbi:MAG: hypothetical protein ACPL0A_00900 [Candidatus Micrarchaeia archaeon]